MSNSLHVACRAGLAILLYGRATGLSVWTRQRQDVKVVTTPCNKGGERHWFLCPTCGRRVAILYQRGTFACRTCHGLGYRSQRETAFDRAITQTQKVRQQLGWSPNLTVPPAIGRPMGMRVGTYNRLMNKHARQMAKLQDRSRELFARMGLPGT